MPALLQFLGSIVAWFFGRTTAELGKKVGTRLAIIALIGTAFVTLRSAVQAIAGTFSVSMPTVLIVPLSWVIPNLFDEAIAAMLAIEVAIWAYKYAVKIATATASA